jgi:hypothetical protein
MEVKMEKYIKVILWFVILVPVHTLLDIPSIRMKRFVLKRILSLISAKPLYPFQGGCGLNSSISSSGASVLFLWYLDKKVLKVVIFVKKA